MKKIENHIFRYRKITYLNIIRSLFKEITRTSNSEKTSVIIVEIYYGLHRLSNFRRASQQYAELFVVSYNHYYKYCEKHVSNLIYL